MRRGRDIEDTLDLFVSVLKAGYNTKLDAINSSKSLVLDIPSISTDNYFDSLDRNIGSTSFVLYGIESTSPSQSGNDINGAVTFHFVACYESAGNINFNRMMLRVQKAMTEVLLEAYGKEIKNNFTVINTEPLLLVDDYGAFTKAAGVTVEVII